MHDTVSTKQVDIHSLPILEEYAKLADIALNNKELAKFVVFKQELLEWNKKLNLTGITDDRGIELKHFADSMSLLKLPQINSAKFIIDLGTGAGFPGIPLAIMFPNTHIILVESVKKKVVFLEHIVKVLELKNVTIRNARMESMRSGQLISEADAKKTIIVARAVSALGDLTIWSQSFLEKGVTACFQKSKLAVEAELAAMKTDTKVIYPQNLSYKTLDIEAYGFPELENRVFVLCNNDAIVS